MSTEGTQFNVRAVDADDVPRLLSIDAEWLADDLAAGAPVNEDGSLDLVAYAAWLNKVED